MTIADNLAAHALGCFYENFSSVQRFCSFCDMRNSIFKAKDFNNFQLRTPEGYENNAKLVAQNPDLLHLYGVKDISCLNCLKFYHVINGLPPDPAHDLFEGFCIDFMSNLVVHYVKAKVFTIKDLNGAILSFDYADIDKNNKPQCQKEKPLSHVKCGII